MCILYKNTYRHTTLYDVAARYGSARAGMPLSPHKLNNMCCLQQRGENAS